MLDDDDIFGGDDDLASFLSDDDPKKEEESEDDLFAFLEDEDEKKEEEESEDGLFSFLEEDKEEKKAKKKSSKKSKGLSQDWSQKPEPALPFKKENRKARLDITKNSSEDHRYVKRYTKKELNDQLKKDYRYMKGKRYMMIQPVTIMAKYPYKKKKSDSDIPKESNTELDYVLVIGKLPKWRGTEQFRGKPYKLGHIMYVRRGEYWVNGEVVPMKPHFAITIRKSKKRIKSKRIRDMLAPLKQRLRTGKPFTIYKEFPIIVKKTGLYS